MPGERTKKEKALAFLTVITLFLIVGVLLWSVSLNNKNNTEILKKKILQLNLLKENKLKLNTVNIIASSSPLITSKSFITLAITDSGLKKILDQKNPDLVLPIASITKLMVAIITLENTTPETKITATLDYIGKEESAFVLETNKVYKVSELLANALVSSDNDSVRLLSSILGESNFIAKMNAKASELRMNQTSFVNTTGLDPATSTDKINVSTVTDLANLLVYIKNKHPEILEITRNSNYNVCDIEDYCKNVLSTNKLLSTSTLAYKIIGGKTGSTDLAHKNLVLITELSDGVKLINIVLGSDDNFSDTLLLINNVKK